VVRPRAAARALRWLGVSVLLGAVLWAPPLIDQLVHAPGNLTILAEHFATPPEATIGFREGGRLLFEHLDLWNLVVDGPREPGQYVAIFPRQGRSRRVALP
ncbi:MAG: hypothetical protein M3Q68_01420, partial [Actinomycetota bacterium]|nr:hypothetical protein [Actinomycetota bacterium]